MGEAIGENPMTSAAKVLDTTSHERLSLATTGALRTAGAQESAAGLWLSGANPLGDVRSKDII